MNKETIISGIAGLVIGAVLTLALVPGLKGDSQSSEATANNLDAHFIEQMIPHHESAIAMAKLAQQRGEHQEIKTLANNIITAQEGESTQMKEWYKSWFGKDVPTASMDHSAHGAMSNMMMGSSMNMEALETANPFDKAFIEEMIMHHEMAVMMAQMLLAGTERAEMKKLANDIIEAQTNEINQMKGWLEAWY